MIEKVYCCRKTSDLPPEWGQVIESPAGEATFHTDILSYWDGIASLAVAGETGIGWFELSSRPFTGGEVECHRLTPEALLCFQGAAACFVGRPVDGETLGPEDAAAFYVEQGKGFVFSPGTWHSLPFPITDRASFWVLFRKGTAQTDLEVLNLEQKRQWRFKLSMG